MSAVAVRADRRFRRAHVKPSRKRGWAGALKPLLGSAVVLTALGWMAYQGASVIVHAHALQVDRITVSGNARLSRDEVIALVDGLRGESIVFVNLERWRRRLLASPWISDAALRRSLPSTVEVTVWERQPIGTARIGGEMYLIDERGVVIDQFGPQYADLDLPIIDGLGAAPHDSATITDEARADLAARVIAAVKAKPKLAERLSQVDVSDAHNAAVILTGDPAVVHIGEDQFAQRLQSYVELAPALRDRVADIDSVDLRFGNRVYVRPAKVDRKKGR